MPIFNIDDADISKPVPRLPRLNIFRHKDRKEKEVRHYFLGEEALMPGHCARLRWPTARKCPALFLAALVTRAHEKIVDINC